jgi:hypothetical protein
MKKPDMACTTIRQTPLHVPDTGAYIRQGLSNMFDAPTIPEGGGILTPVGNHLFAERATVPHTPPGTVATVPWTTHRSERYRGWPQDSVEGTSDNRLYVTDGLLVHLTVLGQECSQPDDQRHGPLSDKRLSVLSLCSLQSDRVCRISRAASNVPRRVAISRCPPSTWLSESGR